MLSKVVMFDILAQTFPDFYKFFKGRFRTTCWAELYQSIHGVDIAAFNSEFLGQGKITDSC